MVLFTSRQNNKKRDTELIRAKQAQTGPKGGIRWEEGERAREREQERERGFVFICVG